MNVIPVHFIAFGHKSETVKTKCDIAICATYPQDREALPSASDERIKYTGVPSKTTCPDCLAALSKMGMPKS